MTRTPYDVKLTEEQRKCLALFACDAIQDGQNAQGANEADVDYWHQLYEQARTRSNAPWSGAADLTSPLGAEKVDALHARIMKTIWTDPVWTVEGYGSAADRAPWAEEFHQWKVEEERLQSVMDRATLQALIEPRGLIEVSEGSDIRTTRKTVTAALQTDPMTGGLIYDDDGEAIPQTNADGTFIESTDPNAPAKTILVDHTDVVRSGPVYRILPYRDSLILPGHARDKDEIWGYGKRFWRRMSDLKAKATGKRAIYDMAAIEMMAATSERESDLALQRSKMTVTPDQDGTAPKELWECLLLLNLQHLFESRDISTGGKSLAGERWYLVTLHVPTQQLLRVQYDDLEQGRFVPIILFPRIDRATEGFSFIGHKLLTIIEEDTAWHNMAADRAALKNGSPIKRLVGALWEPAEQPFGPRAVIDVRDMNEVQAFDMPDVPTSVFQHMDLVDRRAERVAGINDVASGQVATESRTLGEVQMATEQSFVRMDLIVRRMQESMEDLAQIRHAIWKRVLAERPDGIELPAQMLQNLEGRGVQIDGSLPNQKITAQLLDGAFKFKPHGSVETADPRIERQDFIGFMQMLPTILQLNPTMAMQFQTPQAGRALLRTFLKVFRVPNVQAFIGSPAQDLQQGMAAPMNPLMQMMMGGGMPPGPPGLPPGPPAPPMGAPGVH